MGERSDGLDMDTPILDAARAWFPGTSCVILFFLLRFVPVTVKINKKRSPKCGLIRDSLSKEAVGDFLAIICTASEDLPKEMKNKRKGAEFQCLTYIQQSCLPYTENQRDYSGLLFCQLVVSLTG